MSDKTKINMLVGAVLVLIVFMGLQIGKVEELEIQHMFALDSRSYPGNQIENITDRLADLEEAMWLEGYEYTREESMPHMNNRLLQEQFRDILTNTVAIQNLDNQINFPYVSQLGSDAPYENDCGPAAISMVTKSNGGNYQNE